MNQGKKTTIKRILALPFMLILGLTVGLFIDILCKIEDIWEWAVEEWR